MVIYSIVPSEVIFRNDYEKVYSESEYIEIDNIKLEVKKIHRIISTDPFDYLKSEYQPGRIIHLSYKPHI